jgi:hypothetical protein
MKKFSLIIFFLMGTIPALLAQNLEIYLSIGSFRISNQQRVEQPIEGFNLHVGLNYQLGTHWTLGTSINHSVNQYYRASAINTPLVPLLGSLPLEGKVLSDHFSFVIGRKIKLPWNLTAEVGTGIGVFVEENQFMQVVDFDEEKKAYAGFFRKTVTTVGYLFDQKSISG